MAQPELFEGFELGPIRPPSEAYSLLLRINRSCSWNKCRFCGFYRGESFSIRPVEDILRDIDHIKYWIDVFQGRVQGHDPRTDAELEACSMAYHWIQAGMQTVFFQDGNAIVYPPERMLTVLNYLRQVFPHIHRITSYARSDAILRVSDENLKKYAQLGLNRFHIGLETGNDFILRLMNKGVTKQQQIEAGIKAMRAGIEINEFYMPNMGGREYARESAVDTADVMNQVNPDFIRIRSMALAKNLEMYADYESGMLTRPNDIDTIREIRVFIENLHGINSWVDSDHILNILLELKGRMPYDKEAMLGIIDRFLELPEEKQNLFRLGRRMNIMSEMTDLNNPHLVSRVQEVMDRSNISKDNIDMVCDQLMIRAIPI